MATTEPIHPEPRRRLFTRLPRPLWIGVAALVLAVMAIALRAGVPIYRQQAAIREIERLGGWVLPEKRGPNWLRRWIGNRATRLGLATKAVFTSTKIKDADLAVLAPLLHNFESLILARTNITDGGLVHLAGLQELRELNLDDTNVTDAGLVHLKTMTNLETLGLYGTHVTEDGVAMLQKALPRLKIRTYPLARVAPAARRYEFVTGACEQSRQAVRKSQRRFAFPHSHHADKIPAMLSVVLTLGVVFAAFCIWLSVRIINRRERWAKRTAASLFVGIVGLYFLSHPWACAFIEKNSLLGSPVYHGVQAVYVPFGWAYGALPESIQSRYWAYYDWSLAVCGVETEPR